MSTSKFAKSSIIVSTILAFGYLLSFVKESIIANYFGISADVDAYTIAITIPVVLFSIVTVSIKSVIVPIYSDLLYNKTKDVADGFISNVLCCVGAAVLVLIGLMEIGADCLTLLFAPGFDVATHDLSTSLLRITLPSILFTVINDILLGVLNVHKRFIASSYAMFFLNFGLILTIVFLHSKFGIVAAALGYIIGGCLMMLYVFLISTSIYSFHFSFNFKDESLIRTIKQTIPVVWSTSIAEINAVLNRIIATYLFVGSVSALSYANKINSIFISFFITAVATIVYPLYAESSAKRNMDQLSHRVNFTLSLYTMILMPMFLGILCFRKELVSIAFARGVFDDSAVATTASLLGCYCLGLIFMSFRETLTKVFYSLQDMKTPTKNATIGVLLNIGLNLTLPLIWGVEGLALGTSLTAMFISMRLLYLLKKNYKQIQLKYFQKNVIGIALSAVVMTVIVFTYSYFYKGDNNIVKLIIGVGIALVSYSLSIWMFRVPVFKQALQMFFKK